jgi:hypothetical protein
MSTSCSPRPDILRPDILRLDILRPDIFETQTLGRGGIGLPPPWFAPTFRDLAGIAGLRQNPSSGLIFSRRCGKSR